MSTIHTCQGVVLHCIDFRFRKQLAEFLHKRFPQDDYDLVVNAGAVKPLLAQGEDSRFLLTQFAISHRLHHPSVIVLVQHEDCGAYGGSGTFGDAARELEFQKGELEKAGELLAQSFPGIRIERYFAKLSKEVAAV